MSPAGRLRPRQPGDDPLLNRLLAMLPDEDRQRWLPLLAPIEVAPRQVLHEAGATPIHAYFPTTAIVALQYVTEDGWSMGVAQVGREGMVGTSLFMGGGPASSRAVVQGAGLCFRMGGTALREEFERSPFVARVLLRYTQALIAQVAQVAACSRHHPLEQQLCRWLLFALDRLPGNEVVATQEMISQMLGARREGVTEAALALQQDGLIRYRRGRIAVLDRPGLESRACECHAAVKAQYDRLLPFAVRA